MIHLLRFEYTREMQIRDRVLSRLRCIRMPVTFICEVATLTPAGWPTDDPRQIIDDIWNERAKDMPRLRDNEPDWGSYIATMTGTEPGTESVNGAPIPPPAAAALFWHAQAKPYVPGLRAVRVSNRGTTAEYAELPEPAATPAAPARPQTEMERIQAEMDKATADIDRLIKSGLPTKPGKEPVNDEPRQV